jgi:hypothetical protein
MDAEQLKMLTDEKRSSDETATSTKLLMLWTFASERFAFKKTVLHKLFSV